MGHVQNMRVWVYRLYDVYKEKGADQETMKTVGDIADAWRAEIRETLDKTGVIKNLGQ